MSGPKHFWEHCWLFWFVQLIAWSFESCHHSLVANNTSAVIFKKTYFGLILLYNYPSLWMCKQILKCYLLNDNNSNLPHDPFDVGIFYTYVSICSLHISEKCFSLNAFIRLSALACFPIFFKTHPWKKTRAFYSVFGLVIAVWSFTAVCLV